MLTTKVVGVEGGREPACGEFPSTFVVSIVPTQPNCALMLMLLGFHTACSTDWPPRGNCLPIQEWPEKMISIHRFTASLAIFGLTFQLNKYFWITASTFLQFCSKFSFSYKISSIFLHFSSNDYKGIVSLWYYFCSLYAGFHILRSKLRTKVLDFRAKVKAQQMMPVISKA